MKKQFLLTLLLMLLFVTATTTAYQDKDAPAFTACIKSDPGTRPQFIRFSTETGQFSLEDCADRFILSGQGKFSVNGCIQKLTYKSVAAPQYVLQVTRNICTDDATVTLSRNGQLLYSFNDGSSKGNSCACIR